MKLIKKTISILICITLLSIFCMNSVAVYEDFKNQCEMKITDELSEVMDSIDNNEQIPVVVWLEQADLQSAISYANADDNISSQEIADLINNELNTAESIDLIHELKNKKTSAAKEVYSSLNASYADTLKNYGEITYICSYAPAVFMTTTKNEINKITEQLHTECIFYDNPELEFEPMLDISRQVIRANQVQTNSVLGYTGNGIRLGMIEMAFPDVSKEELQGATIIKESGYANVDDTDDIQHATYVAEIMVGQGTSKTAKGIAPDATLYCSYISGNDFAHAFEWMIDQNVDIVNMSVGSTSNFNTYNSIDSFVDYYSCAYMTTFVVASGNEGTSGVTSPGMAYNAITVGNVNDKNTVSVSDDSLYATSGYVNSKTIDSTASKPDLCAPGTNISLEGSSTGISGTSFATPHVAASAALLGEEDSLLLLSPVAMKSVLVAGVKSSNHCYVPSERTVTTNATYPASSYAQYGAGITDCAKSALLVKSENYDFSYMSKSATSTSFKISCNANSKVRISLVFEKTYVNTSSSGTVIQGYNNNLDLKVYNSSGTLIGSSTTKNNNVEIVDFTPTSTETYTITIERVSTSNPSDVRFAYAWVQG